MTYRKKLIEVALPLEAINAASAREKSIRHGHPSTLHLWWARRPLAACRAVIFTSLVDDPDDPDAPPEFVQACRELPRGKNAAANDTPRQRLFDFIEILVKWESTTDEQVLETARHLIRLATDGNPPPLLDPFAGGGSIPLEAQRLGLEAHASDLNPVAVMINKALIEIPPKFANMPPVNPRDREGTAGSAGWKGAAGLAADVRYYGEWMRDRAWERIGHLYPDYNGETVIVWLWTRTVKSPNPAVDVYVPLARNFWLEKNKGRKVWIEPVLDRSTERISFEIRSGSGQAPKPTMKRGGGTCLVSGAPITYDYIRREGQAGRMHAQMMAIVTKSSSGRGYYAPNDEHIDAAQEARPAWKPEQLVTTPSHDVDRLPMYGMYTWADAFAPRQLVALATFSELVNKAHQEIQNNAVDSGGHDEEDAQLYADAVATYLALAVGRSANYWSSFTTWAGSFIVQTFGRQAIPMVWDFSEGNPFSNMTGNWLGAIEWIAKVLEQSIPAIGYGAAAQKDAVEPIEQTFPLICTDPPYYDNVGYADLSDFFYVWLRPTMGKLYPALFSTILTPKSREIIAAPHRFDGNKKLAEQHFLKGLNTAFGSIRDGASAEYPVTIFYAFKQAETDDRGSTSSTGWGTMLEGLIRSGFTVVGTWPVRTERDQGLKTGTNVLASSIVLVCRPRPDDAPMTSRREFVNALRLELPTALREMQSGNIAPVDLAQASIGPGMAVYSRYNKVLEPNGDRLTVRTALQIINHELDAYLAEQEGYIDADSRFAMAWFEQFGFQEGGFGQADVLARAKNTSVDGLAHAGVLVSGAGKVRLYDWSELDPGWDPSTDERLTTWEATHHLIERLNTHSEDGAARLLAKMPPDLAAQARQLAYRLYSICERKGWAEHARDYNTLAISWSASQEQARGFKVQYQQGRLL